MHTNRHIYSADKAGHLDNSLRRLLQNPYKIIKPYVKPGMKVLELGCGNGYFTIPIAQSLGVEGKVIAVDILERMLDKLQVKAAAAQLSDRIIFHCSNTLKTITQRIDFALAAYVFHELPDELQTLIELNSLLKNGSYLLIIEPDFIVSKKAFRKTIDAALIAGFEIIECPHLLLSKSVLLKKGYFDT